MILLAVLSRLLPHPLNFTPIAAIALFGGVYLDKKHTFIVPLAALLISDYFIGFYEGVAWVYASFIMIGFIGLWLREHRGVGTTVLATFTGSVVFFIVSNFGVWLSSQVSYPRTFAGLIECYTMAIPFFRNSLAGDGVYVLLLFGLYELVARTIPKLALRPVR
jgi:hypothetical protein